MKIVIQCAAKKHPHAGYLTGEDGARIMFVADPKIAPACRKMRYARPDDRADDGRTWREYLLACNASGGNPRNLVPAYKLYAVTVYEELAARYGADHVFILSAGWGLVNAAFRLPQYDITFSPAADTWKRRKKHDRYEDFRPLPPDCDDDLVFFGGKDYQPLFSHLSRQYRGRRLVFYNTAAAPEIPGCELIRYRTTTRTNWHYPCAKDFMNGQIGLDG